MQIDREDRDKHSVDMNPVNDEDDDRKNAELADRTTCEKSDCPENSIITDHLGRVRGPGLAQPNPNSFFDWQSNLSCHNLFHLTEISYDEQQHMHNWGLFSPL
jgi:hypothetical protein